MESNHKELEKIGAGNTVAVKIVNEHKPNIAYGRHFDHTTPLHSLISRKSIDALKENFKSDLSERDWRLVIKLKKIYGII